jgi:WD40 repeat protein
MTLTYENIFASSSYDQTIWNLTSSSILHTLTGHNESVFTLKSLSHKVLASGGVNKTIKMWNVTSGKLNKHAFGSHQLTNIIRRVS